MMSGNHSLDEMYAKDRESIRNLIEQIIGSGKKNTFSFIALLDANNEQILEWQKVHQKRDGKIFDGIPDRDLSAYIEFLKNPCVNGKTYAEDQGAIDEYKRRIEAKGLHTSLSSGASSASATASSTNDDEPSESDLRKKKKKKKHSVSKEDQIPNISAASTRISMKANTNTSTTAMNTWGLVDFCTPKVVGTLIIISSIAIKFAMDYMNHASQQSHLQR